MSELSKIEKKGIKFANDTKRFRMFIKYGVQEMSPPATMNKWIEGFAGDDEEIVDMFLESGLWLQSTQKEDKNGEEIFEGDVVEDKAGNRYAVRYSSSKAAFRLMNMKTKKTKYLTDDLIRIGSMFEKPELMKDAD